MPLGRCTGGAPPTSPEGRGAADDDREMATDGCIATATSKDPFGSRTALGRRALVPPGTAAASYPEGGWCCAGAASKGAAGSRMPPGRRGFAPFGATTAPPKAAATRPSSSSSLCSSPRSAAAAAGGMAPKPSSSAKVPKPASAAAMSETPPKTPLLKLLKPSSTPSGFPKAPKTPLSKAETSGPDCDGRMVYFISLRCAWRLVKVVTLSAIFVGCARRSRPSRRWPKRRWRRRLRMSTSA
mmetsp:Transcript_10826/g.32865  ORF Transcript_10826/g.32865 Transcript_10826/m.32865 type:complete len:241 (-) Transcript_10826:1303-2025(-)